MQFYKVVIFFSCLIAGKFFLIAQTNTIKNYNTFINLIETEYPQINSSNNLSTIAIANKMASKGMYDTYLEGDISNKFYGTRNYYTVANAEVKQQLFAGQFFKAGYEYGQGTLINPEDARPTYGLAYVGIEASLLQGMFIDKKRFEVLKSIQYEKILNNEKQIEINDILYMASNSYVDWLKEYQLLKLNETFAQQALKRYLALKIASDIGERPAIDTIEASILYQTRNIETTTSKINFAKSNAQLSNLIWQANTNSLLNSLPEEDIESLFLMCSKNIIELKTINPTANPYIAFYTNKVLLLKIEKRFKTELLKPKLDVKYNFLGYSNNGDSFAAQLSPNNYNWGAKFSMPLLLRTSRNELKATNFYIKNAGNDLLTKSAELHNKTEVTKTNLINLLQQYQSAKQMLVSTQLLFDAEKLKFENGESSLFLVNSRENKIIEAQIKLLEAQVKYLQTYFYLIYLQGAINYKL